MSRLPAALKGEGAGPPLDTVAPGGAGSGLDVAVETVLTSLSWLGWFPVKRRQTPSTTMAGGGLGVQASVSAPASRSSHLGLCARDSPACFRWAEESLAPLGHPRTSHPNLPAPGSSEQAALWPQPPGGRCCSPCTPWAAPASLASGEASAHQERQARVPTTPRSAGVGRQDASVQ